MPRGLLSLFFNAPLHNPSVFELLTFRPNRIESKSVSKIEKEQQIPADRDEIPRPEMVQAWPHLQRISKHIPPYMDSVEVGLLIGLNCPGAVRPRDVICGNKNDPYAIRSSLGWYVNGPVSHKSSKQVHCNQIQILKRSIDDKVNGYIVGERRSKSS